MTNDVFVVVQNINSILEYVNVFSTKSESIRYLIDIAGDDWDDVNTKYSIIKQKVKVNKEKVELEHFWDYEEE